MGLLAGHAPACLLSLYIARLPHSWRSRNTQWAIRLQLLTSSKACLDAMNQSVRPVHPDTLFHLEPIGADAISAALHHENAAFISMSSDGAPALEIGYHVSSRPRGGRVIATLGREADLVLLGANIARVHFSFEVHPVSHAILFRLHAEKLQSVRVEPRGLRTDGDIRQLVVVPGAECRIFVGNSTRRMLFKVRWRSHGNSISSAVVNGFQAAQSRAANPRWLRTRDTDDDDVQTWYNTRLQSRRNGYVRDALLRRKLGAGAFGSVHESIDLDSGHLIAVKLVKPEGDRAEANLHREIKTLQTLSHVR